LRFDNSQIISHAHCRELEDRQWDDSINRYAEFIDGEVHMRLPDFVFEGCIYFPDDRISIFHTPGHTPDSISVYDEVERVLYAGDNIGDKEDEIVPWINTDLQTFRDLIETYKTYDFDICVSGHNKPQTKAVLSRMEASLEDSWKKQSESVNGEPDVSA
jgi:glyoxylase-like metal-dependent hydrolase (beta-lactamase superfamily II)